MRGGVAGLVDVGLGFEVLDADVGDILFGLDAAHSAGKDVTMSAYLHLQVRVHQDLELEVLLALIGHLQRGCQRIFGQSNAVDKPKLIRPSLPKLLAQHAMRQSKIQLHSQIPLSRLGRRLAQEFPVRVAREAMLWQG